MGLKEWLLPPEREFFDLLDRQAGFVLEGAHALRDLLQDFPDVTAKREDIMALASDLDNVLDLIDAAANRMDLYEIPEPSRAMVDFSEVIVEAAAAMQKAVGMIRNMKNADLVEKICVEVNRLETVADELLN